MEKQRPLAQKPGEGGAKPASDATVPNDTDPRWDELGSTQVVPHLSDASTAGSGLSSASNHTEFSPSLILGKNLVALGDFKLIKKLGEGAMGAVYKAVQTSRNRTVALKILFPHVANNAKLVERLRREGLVMGLLDHPNIVQAYAVDSAEGCHFVAMEYVSGQSTQKWLNQLGRFPVGDAVRVALDCAKALSYAHAQNIIHRDIKPDNILLTKTGVVKVADLGMAKTHDEDMSLTQTGHAVGTPWFMPLEQARNAKEIDGRSDIYALGCTLYALLTGSPPFMGRTIVDIIQAKEIGTFAPARQANSDVPERLDLILAKMTAKLPKYRYQSCDEVVKDLESLNLASDKLTFLVRQAAPVVHAQETPVPGKTTVMPFTKPKAETDFGESAAAPHDADVWYVQVKMSDGAVVARKYNTAQLQTMVAEGTIAPTAKASHTEDDGFRAIATYKEFQGVALSKMSKKAADKNTAKYRGLYKKIEEADREAAEKERAKNREPSAMSANTRYWMEIGWKFVLPIGLGIGALVLLSYLAKNMF